MFESFHNTLHLLKASYRVLESDKELLLFPVISAIIVLSLIASIAVYFYLDSFDSFYYLAKNNLLYPIIILVYWAIMFVITFFNAGLITCAHIRINGDDPRFQDGISNAEKHIVKIFLWSGIVAFVGLITKLIEAKFGNIGKIISYGISAGWSVATFFVLPILIFEEKPIKDSFKESINLLKKTWGENVIGQTSIGIICLLLLIPGILLSTALILLVQNDWLIPTIVSIVGYGFVVIAFVSSLQGIFNAVLYNYAKTGKIPDGFDSLVVKSAFKPK